MLKVNKDKIHELSFNGYKIEAKTHSIKLIKVRVELDCPVGYNETIFVTSKYIEKYNEYENGIKNATRITRDELKACLEIMDILKEEE